MITYTTDNGKTWLPCPGGIVVRFSDVDIPEHGTGELQVCLSTEGVGKVLSSACGLIDDADDHKDITDIVEELLG